MNQILEEEKPAKSGLLKDTRHVCQPATQQASYDVEVKGPQVASVQEPQAVCQEGSPGMQQGQQKLPTIGELVTEQLSL